MDSSGEAYMYAKSGGASCDMFNLGSSYFHVALTTVRHLLTVSDALVQFLIVYTQQTCCSQRAYNSAIQTVDPGAIGTVVNVPLAVVMIHDLYCTLKSIRTIQRRWWLPDKTV